MLSCLSCTKADGTGSSRLVVTGSSTLAPLLADLAASYERLHPEVRIDVQSGGSGRGIADARSGVADFGMVSRDLYTEEGDLKAWTLARDGVGLLVHEENPIPALTSNQVRAIYRGEITDWSQLGGAAGRITVVHKAEGRATLQVFLDYFGLKNPEIHADIIAGENEHAIKTIAGDRRALGYVSIGTAEEDILHGISVRLVDLDGVPASSEEVAAGRFPMTRALNLVAPESPHGVAADFLLYVMSSEANDQIRAFSFTPLTP
ncbi:MAG: phosphate ABC transporter substrate-binding protein [Planctomycetota bacterium]|nr:phosphate ABC transporter substrate-binding protein [Planctomycetota bacterium]MDA1113308.1 phosphate ABC transporter substrate-binding protein [Planctomycetota bacterium]